MAKTIATIKGTMLAPGISKNNRKYTPEAIGRMVSRMQDRLNDPNALPVVMRTHHDAGDNSRLIVGRITSVQQESDGRATYSAKIYDTVAGRDIAALIDSDGTAPALRTTSVYGRWMGTPRMEKENGQRIEVGEDLAVDALDFTASPGVEQSRIDSVAFESYTLNTSSFGDVPLDGEHIFESYDIDEWDFTEGLTEDQLPIITSKGTLRSAIKLVGGDQDTVRKHIMERAAALGLSKMIPEDWTNTTDESSIVENQVVVCVQADDGTPIVKIAATNVDYGDIKKAAKAAAKIAVRVIDPNQSDASNSIDTDGDGVPDNVTNNGNDYNVSVGSGKTQDDMSVPSGGDSTVKPAPGSYPSADSQQQQPIKNSVEATDMSVLEVKVDGVNGLDNLIEALSAVRKGQNNTTTSNTTPTAPAVEETTKEESAVSETEKTAAAAAPGLSEADMAKLAALIGAAVKEAMDPAANGYNANAKANAKAKGKNIKGKSADTPDNGPAPAESTSKAGKDVVTETAKPASELSEADKKKLVDELRESLIKEGAIPQRKGSRYVSESDTDAKEPTGDELWDRRSEIWAPFFPWGQNATPVVVAPTDAA